MDEELKADYEKQSNYIRTIAEKMLTEHVGDRCPDYEPSCESCKRWKALDALVDNPYS